ncbi:hypothetical protein A0H81_02464 [Grifola frondosa]|uniref:Uncharacterized protein n=1 Tax=Grifola frondosa TaxID=5627 RepID=A0A1C7MNB2_GRIFR|nr:hypothetical protein A0H81_02464 [Grifola frondosa]
MSSIITFVSLLACFRPRADDIEAQLAGAKEANADDVADLLPQMARLEGRPLRSKFLFNWGFTLCPGFGTPASGAYGAPKFLLSPGCGPSRSTREGYSSTREQRRWNTRWRVLSRFGFA